MPNVALPTDVSFTHDTRQPVIGLPPRWMTRPAPCSSDPDIQIVNVDHLLCQALLRAGALPVMLPMTHDAAELSHYVELCDGFVFSGGPDVQPRLFGGDPHYDAAPTCPERDSMELPLLGRILAADKPLLTICRGTQLLNVALGGTLCMNLYELPSAPAPVHWHHTGVLAEPAHSVEIAGDSKLAQLCGATELQVNSAHHCCLDKLGEHVRLVAWATDGIAEGIEVEGARFAVGVQWHPEHTWPTIATDFALWQGFVKECARS